MKKHTTQPDSATDAGETASQLFDNWFDPIEFGVRSRVRDFIETMMEEELDAVLSRPRYGRIAPGAGKEAGTSEAVTGHRHGHRSRSLLGTFGPVEVSMPRAATYLAGTNTRRVRRALTTLFGGAVSKDTVSRAWRKVKTGWDAWNARSLADEPIVRLILDGTVVRVRLDRKATAISLLVTAAVAMVNTLNVRASIRFQMILRRYQLIVLLARLST
jgi:transposase-like protein